MLEDVTVNYGTTLHLTCPVYSSDNLVITEWYRDAKLITVKSGTHFTTVSHHKHDGMYHCVAIQEDQRITSNVVRVKIRGIFSLKHLDYCNNLFFVFL